MCGWETHRPDTWTRFRCEALREAQRSFARTGACDPQLIGHVRPPRTGEARPPWWTTLDDAPAPLIAGIETAFADVRLDGGVGLEEAEEIDDYALSSRSETSPPPERYREAPPWQELTIAGLNRFPWGNFAFQDARGIRYYLPAFMRAYLQGARLGAFDALMSTLHGHHRLDLVHALLTKPQRGAVAGFLAYVALSDDLYSSDAIVALRSPWGSALDAEHLALATR